jgi:hypothetical protein
MIATSVEVTLVRPVRSGDTAAICGRWFKFVAATEPGKRRLRLMDVAARHLLLHAVIIYLVGLLAGFPYGAAINRGDSETRIGQWRLAHGSLVVGATTMIAIAAILSHLNVGQSARWLIAGSSIASGYGFAVALPLGAWVGKRGLTPSGPLSNRVVFTGNALGSSGSLLSAVVLLYACWQSL